MTPTAPIIADEDLPDGMVLGFDATGALIVSLVYAPVFQRLYGTEDYDHAVTAWHMSTAAARRMRALSAWNTCGLDYPTAGCA